MYGGNNRTKNIDFKLIFAGMFAGIILLIILTTFCSLIYSTFNFFSYELVSKILLISNFLIITSISFNIAQKIGRKGWLNGGLTGIIYMALLILITLFNISYSPGLITIILFSGLISGIIGGIIGINFK